MSLVSAVSADTRGLSFQTQPSPQDYNPFAGFHNSAIVNLSVNQTRGHSSHKWLLVFSTVGLCGLLTPIEKQVHLGTST